MCYGHNRSRKHSEHKNSDQNVTLTKIKRILCVNIDFVCTQSTMLLNNFRVFWFLLLMCSVSPAFRCSLNSLLTLKWFADVFILREYWVGATEKGKRVESVTHLTLWLDKLKMFAVHKFRCLGRDKNFDFDMKMFMLQRQHELIIYFWFVWLCSLPWAFSHEREAATVIISRKCYVEISTLFTFCFVSLNHFYLATATQRYTQLRWWHVSVFKY